MIKKLIHTLMAATLALGVSFSTMQPAEARNGAGVAAGVAAGIIGLGILGAAAEARARDRVYYGPACYQGPRECHWTGRVCHYNQWGEYVCGGGRYQCYRPTICP
jgi:hypothetical protein